MRKIRQFSTVMLATLLPICISHAQDLTGFCLDLGEGGCTDRFLPFDQMSIGFCEESCTLTSPFPVRGLDAMLYDMECVSDNPGPVGGRVMILRQVNRGSSSIKSYMIDASQIRPIVICP